ADRLQPGLVDEAGQADLAKYARRGVSRYGHRDLALLIDGDRTRGLRDRDSRLHDVAIGRDNAPLGVEIERAVAGVGERAVRHQDLEEAVALYRQIERVAGGRQVARVIRRGVPTVLTPSPSSMPTGRMLPWLDDWVPTWRTWSYSRS